MFNILRKLIRAIYRHVYGIYLDITYSLYGIEGINRVVLRTRRPKYVLTKFGAKIGEGTIVYSQIVIHAAKKDYSNLIVGKKCRLMRCCFLDLSERIELADTAIIGIGARVITHVNFGDSAVKEHYPVDYGAVTIEKGAILSVGSTVLHGVTIGEYSIIGADTLVIRNVPPNSVVIGKLARVVKKIKS